MEHLEGILWYSAWPVLIYLAYRFVLLNLKHYTKMERLEMLEEKFGDQLDSHLNKRV